MKPYQGIPIQECGEPLVSIPLEKFAVESPHPYEKLGASYGEKSPYYLRQGVLQALLKAQKKLQQLYPGWLIQIFDAYRPIEVQQFMVDYTFNSVIAAQNLNLEQLSLEQRQIIWEQVYQLWAIPSDNPATPPPHSTGAAIDVTLVNIQGKTIDMGGEIDELSVPSRSASRKARPGSGTGMRSQPDYYINSTDRQAQQYHHYRQLLNQVMSAADFRRHPGEWWHFSLGDQMWAWQNNLENPHNLLNARYGRVI